MEQPKGFVASGQERLVCRLRKSLYGRKHELRQWYKKFDDFIKSIGFSKRDEHHCLFTKPTQDGSPIFLIIFVDDMLLSGRHTGELAELIRKLRLRFAMKDLGPARPILRMKISRHRNQRQLSLSQTDYIGRVLERSTSNQPNLLWPRSPLIFGCLNETSRHPFRRGKI